ncbi:ubiquitin-protein transferase [Aureococcus anophagefferens]|nr:ubiquitin-protein transferase [Aureococcus anophagefferens]
MAALAGFAPPKKLAGFADAKKQLKGFADAAPAKSAAAPLTSAAAAAPHPPRRRSRASPRRSPRRSRASPRRGPRRRARCVCFEGPEDSDEPLVSPCACRGDSKYAHASCLAAWAEAASRRGGAQSYKCPTCKTRYFGATAVALAVQRVDLELDRPAAPADDGDLTNVEAAVYNMKVVCAYEDVALDAALLKRYLNRATRAARAPEVLAVLARLDGGRGPGGGGDRPDERALAAEVAAADPKTSADELDLASKRHVLSMLVVERCVLAREDAGGVASARDERRYLDDAEKAKALAAAALATCRRILGPSHPDTGKYLRFFGQISMVCRFLGDNVATRAKREAAVERLRG